MYLALFWVQLIIKVKENFIKEVLRPEIQGEHPEKYVKEVTPEFILSRAGKR